MQVTCFGVDLAKNVVQVRGVDRSGPRVWKWKLRRLNWIQAVADRLEQGCEIGTEPRGGAHH